MYFAKIPVKSLQLEVSFWIVYLYYPNLGKVQLINHFFMSCPIVFTQSISASISFIMWFRYHLPVQVRVFPSYLLYIWVLTLQISNTILHLFEMLLLYLYVCTKIKLIKRLAVSCDMFMGKIIIRLNKALALCSVTLVSVVSESVDLLTFSVLRGQIIYQSAASFDSATKWNGVITECQQSAFSVWY